MPRIQTRQTKTAAVAAHREPYRLTIKTNKKPTNFQRAGAALTTLLLAGRRTVTRQEFIDYVTKSADGVDDHLGPRAEIYLKHAGYTLSFRKYITKKKFRTHEANHSDVEYVSSTPEDDEEWMLTPKAELVLNCIEDNLNRYSFATELEKYRARCFLVGHWMGPSKAPTCKELKQKIDVLEETIQRLEGHCLAASEIAMVSDDSMDIDKVLVAGPCSDTYMSFTPAKKSGSLNNAAAYPSPESLPRRTTSRDISPASSSPAIGSRTTALPGSVDGFDDDDADFDKAGDHAVPLESLLSVHRPPSPTPEDFDSSGGGYSNISDGIKSLGAGAQFIIRVLLSRVRTVQKDCCELLKEKQKEYEERIKNLEEEITTLQSVESESQAAQIAQAAELEKLGQKVSELEQNLKAEKTGRMNDMQQRVIQLKALLLAAEQQALALSA